MTSYIPEFEDPFKNLNNLRNKCPIQKSKVFYDPENDFQPFIFSKEDDLTKVYLKDNCQHNQVGYYMNKYPSLPSLRGRKRRVDMNLYLNKSLELDRIERQINKQYKHVTDDDELTNIETLNMMTYHLFSDNKFSIILTDYIKNILILKDKRNEIYSLGCEYMMLECSIDIISKINDIRKCFYRKKCECERYKDHVAKRQKQNNQSTSSEKFKVNIKPIEFYDVINMDQKYWYRNIFDPCLDLKYQYNALIRKFHPDKNMDDRCHDIFIKITKAYSLCKKSGI